MTQKTYPANLAICDHSIVRHKLAQLRSKDTGYPEFRSLIDDISAAVFFDATRSLNVEPVAIETPLEKMNAARLKQEVLLVPILRAGLGMVQGIQKLWQSARVGMLGMYRDHQTLLPVVYYSHLPERLSQFSVFLLDPMLATGGSASAAVAQLKERGATHITLLTIIAAPEGVDALLETYPDIQIHTAALDRKLNEKGYILPGLGDAGDRYFGTE